MENKRPLILVSNDDGIMAKGISELIKFLRPLGEIVVMAPDAPRSGSGCALTVTQPVHYQLLKKDVGLTVYKCSGTPTDCIKLARNQILDRKPDLVVGGINHGDNSATNVHYSGTMGIVIEGCLNGIPSIGFSICDHAPGADFDAAGPYVRRIAAMVLEKGLPPLTCLNVNFPNTQEIKGVGGVYDHRDYPARENLRTGQRTLERRMAGLPPERRCEFLLVNRRIYRS